MCLVAISHGDEADLLDRVRDELDVRYFDAERGQSEHRSWLPP